MKDLMKLSSTEAIRSSLFEADGTEDGIVPEVGKSRLTIPLTTAHRNVASSVAVIGQLSPSDRKEACVKLIDIAEAAFAAVEKTLKRQGTNDPSLLAELKKINRLVEAFDEHFNTLEIKEDLYVNGEDPEENPFSRDPDGTPGTFEDGVTQQEISPIAVRVLANNADMADPKEGEGDPAKDDVEPPEGEATPATVDTDAAEQTIINTLADAADQDEEGKEKTESKLPPTFEEAKGKNENIHEETSENLKLLSVLLRDI